MRLLDTFQEVSDTVLFVGPENTISQTFRACCKNLAGIRLTVFNPNLGGSAKYVVTIENQQGKILRKQMLTESNLEWGRAFRYDFDPIPTSEDNIFALSVAYAGNNTEDSTTLQQLNTNLFNKDDVYKIATESAERIKKEYISLAYQTNDLYPNGEAFINNQKLPGDIAFETYYQINTVGFVSSVVNHVTKQAKDDIFFSAGYVLLILFLLGVVVYRLLYKR